MQSANDKALQEGCLGSSTCCVVLIDTLQVSEGRLCCYWDGGISVLDHGPC